MSQTPSDQSEILLSIADLERAAADGVVSDAEVQAILHPRTRCGWDSRAPPENGPNGRIKMRPSAPGAGLPSKAARAGTALPHPRNPVWKVH